MDLDLAGRSALITGASKGIGLAVAQSLAEEGCDVHLAARTQADLESARDRIVQAHGVEVTVHPTDLSVSANVLALAEAAGDIDILVNNAGAIPGGDIARIDETTWRAAWDLKVFGYVNLTRAVYERMKARGKGAIVNVIGLAGERFDANYIAGSTGNAGLMAFTRALGGASADHGVRVVGVNPGYIATDRMTTLLKRRAQDSFGDQSRWRELLKDLPMGRAGEPEEVAAVVTFLASDRASFISGTIVTLDAGLSARAG